MTGYAVSNEPFTKECPYCHGLASADWLDTGSGLMQVGHFQCEVCGAIEIGRYDTEPTEAQERDTGWYLPKK